MNLWNGQLAWVLTALLFLQAPQAFAGNGGNIYRIPKTQRQLAIEDGQRRAEVARKKTEELNKKWKKQQRKAARAEAKAKRQAEKKQKKTKRQATEQTEVADPR